MPANVTLALIATKLFATFAAPPKTHFSSLNSTIGTGASGEILFVEGYVQPAVPRLQVVHHYRLVVVVLSPMLL